MGRPKTCGEAAAVPSPGVHVLHDIGDSDRRASAHAADDTGVAEAADVERTIALLLVAKHRELAHDLLAVLEAHLLAPQPDASAARAASDAVRRERLARLARLERLREGLIETVGPRASSG